MHLSMQIPWGRGRGGGGQGGRRGQGGQGAGIWCLRLSPCRASDRAKRPRGIAQCKGFQDSLGFWTPRRGFRIDGAGFQSLSMELGFWIPRRGFRTDGAGFQSLSMELGFWIPIVGGIPMPWAVFWILKFRTYSIYHNQNVCEFRNRGKRIERF